MSVADLFSPSTTGQEAFIKDDLVTEVIFGGGSGVGKTTGLLMSFLNQCGKGYGTSWRGILFCSSFDHRTQMLYAMNNWLPRIYPDIAYKRIDSTFSLPSGESIRIGLFSDINNYNSYSGVRYRWIGFDNMTNWVSDKCYVKSIDLLRPSMQDDIPMMLRGTTLFERDKNDPDKPADNWVNRRFDIPNKVGELMHGLLPSTIPALNNSLVIRENNTAFCKGFSDSFG